MPLSLDGAVVLLGGETSAPKIHHSLTGLWVTEVAVGEDMAVVVDKDGRLWQISLKEQGQAEVGGGWGGVRLLEGVVWDSQGGWDSWRGWDVALGEGGWGSWRGWGWALREEWDS